MVLIKSLCIALSTYSAIPMPQFGWDGKAMAYSLCFLPFVGVLAGGALWLWLLFCARFGVGEVLAAAVAAALPVLLTGGIHMDGFCDTVDALSSHQPPQRCLEIMKDSRAGAFAVIYGGLWLILAFGLWAELIRRGGAWQACLVFVLSRAAAVFLVIFMKNARGGGMLAAFTEPARRRAAVASAALWALAAGGTLLRASPVAAGGAAAALAATVLCYVRMANRRFGGVTGDTSGFFVQAGELAMLAGMTLAILILH